MLKKSKAKKPLTNAERQQLFRARQAAEQEKKYWRGNWKIRQEIERVDLKKLFKKWQLAHQIITQFTPSTTRAQTRQYHSHRPATSAERIARHRLKKNCPHSYIVFGKCQNCQLILR